MDRDENTAKCMLGAHDMSMSADPVRASAGRLLKRVYEPCNDWLTDEMDRRHGSGGTVTLAAIEAMGGIMLSIGLSVVADGHQRDVYKALFGAVIAFVERSYRDLDARLNKEQRHGS